MYTLISAKMVSKYELEEYYDLDEFLKLYALFQMQQDIEAAHADELKRKPG
jgi:acyl-CoA-binding protein